MKADAVELGEGKSSAKRGALNRGVSILDFILRVVAIMGTLGSAIAMGTTNQTLPFVTQFVRFRAEYSDLPMFTFFVVANSIVSAYLVLSLSLSIFHILRSSAETSRILLIFFDTVNPSRLLHYSPSFQIPSKTTFGNARSFNGGSLCGSIHRILGAQGEYKGKLVCHLPTV
ncbi:casparian strip membrane protein 3 isoform X2 [Alnus glutinosa]|uniref:casparian strip membrane protein 3 isoform X2 n=1 Tax=Alnus glutinosa TaxID=3517 RepID=UPI002D79D020|nr:casparian strip membrane protein 3 isoform X2 [Alnus glutinosa]